MKPDPFSGWGELLAPRKMLPLTEKLRSNDSKKCGSSNRLNRRENDRTNISNVSPSASQIQIRSDTEFAESKYASIITTLKQWHYSLFIGRFSLNSSASVNAKTRVIHTM